MEEEAKFERLKMENRESDCLVKTDTSMEPPIGLKQEGVHRLKLERQESASSGFLSMKSDQSKDPPIVFKEDSSHRLKTDTSESVFSDCLSVESDLSKERPPEFSEDTSHSAQTSMADESVDASRLEEIRPQNTELCFKLLLAGDTAVGKSCLLRRFVDDIFPTRSQPTIGASFANKFIKMYGKTVRLQLETFDDLKTWLWDIETRCDDNAFKVLELATEHEMPFIETSALTGENVNEAFLTVTRAIMKHHLDGVRTGPAKAKCLVS
ncbi:uncharacterized protein LOC139927508 isoform X4 [Centroberyx gerrardi]